MATKKSAGRTRNFATIVYPESAPADWLERLQNCHVRALVSPLHDRDTKEDGTPKKPHYHVLIMFDGVKSFDTQVKPIYEAIGAVGNEVVNSKEGYGRYLCHLDNPEKAQYNVEDVTELGGAKYAAVIRKGGEELQALSEILSYIKENKIYSLAELVDLVMVNHFEWFEVLTSGKSYIIDRYIRSLNWENDTQYVRAKDRMNVDPDTGEVKTDMITD